MGHVKVRDPVHNFVTLREQEANVVNTPLVQRLRGIRQLAMQSLVYPGALHTRFDHTLGVTHVAGMMCDALSLGEDDRQLIRAATLLHDVGHGPFSHVSEYALDLYGDRNTLRAAQKKEKIHELVTASLIRNDPQVQKVLGEDLCNNVIELLTDGVGARYRRDIVSGPLDADKQDYLLRDSLFCGVEYGKYDINQLHRSLAIHDDGADRYLVVRSGGLHTIEQFVFAKYYMTFDVYRHKGRVVSDQMIVRAIVAGIDIDRIEELQKLYAFDNSPEFAMRYARWSDARFLVAFGGESTTGNCADILRRLIDRRLLKRVFRARRDDLKQLLSPEARDRIVRISDPSMKAERARIEAAVAEAVRSSGVPLCDDADRDHLFIIHSYSIKSAREMSRNDDSGILVLDGGAPEPFTDRSKLFESIDERMSDGYVDIFAPVEWKNHDDRRKYWAKLREPIVRAIEEQVGLFVKEDAI